MEKQISVPFYIASEHRTCVVSVKYSLEKLEDVLLINCSVDDNNEQQIDWLQAGNFELKARRHNGEYKKVPNSGNRVKSVEGIMFIDSVYETIMGREKENLQATPL